MERKRPSYSEEYKQEAVRLVREGKKSPRHVAREIGISESALRKWIKQAEIDEGKGPAGALTTSEREELNRLRRELRQVTLERDFLKKVSTFFAKEQA